jgi:hypothetical protein
MSAVASIKGRVRKGRAVGGDLAGRNLDGKALGMNLEKPRYRRRTVEFHPDIDEVLNQLQSELKLRNQTDVLQKAIQILAILVGTDGKRRRIFLSDNDEEVRELLII